MADITNLVRITGKDESGPAWASATAAAEKFGSSIKSSVVGAFAGVLGVSAFTSAIEGAIKFAEELQIMSQKTGIAVETLGGLGYAAKQNGVDLETLAKGMQKLAQNMAAGNPAFAAMGVAIKDAQGNLIGLDETLFKLADKFASYADGPEKAALATEIFKKGGEALIPLLNEGGEKLRELRDEWEKYGGVTTETAERSKLFEDTIARIQLMSGALWREISASLLPTLQALANIFVDMKSKGDGFKGVAEGVTTAVKIMGIAAIGVIESFKALGTSIGVVFAAFSQAIKGDFSGAWATLKLGFTDVGASIGVAMEKARVVWNASTADMAASAARNLGNARAPILATQKAVEDFAKQLEALIAKIEGKDLGISGEFAAQFKLLTEGFNNGALSLERYQQLTEKLLNQQPWAKKEAEAMAALIKLEEEALKDLAKLQAEGTKALGVYTDQNDRLQVEIGLIGQSEEARARVLVLLDAQVDRQKLIAASDADGLDLLDQQIARRQDLAVAQIQMTKQTQELNSLFQTATDTLASGLLNVFEHGTAGFKDLWKNFVTWGLEAIAKIAAQKIVLQIATSVGLGGAATNAIGSTGGGLGDLLGGLIGGGGGIGDNIGSLLGGTSLMGGSELGSTLGLLGSAVPFLGAALAAAGLLSSMLKKAPSEVKGQFGVSAGTGGFEDNASTSSKFGNLGFLDANTQQFSGQAAQVFNKIVAGALDAFAGRMSEEQQDRLAKILQSTTFAQASGTFTTEDFLQKYGGDVLQQVVSAAFDVLDPAFGGIVATFKGTADEVANFANTLLGIHDAIAPFGADFKAAITSALAGATQATADKVLAFVGILRQFGDVIGGLGPKLQALDPASMLAFVDALGGAAKAVASFNYLTANFTTGAEKMQLATAQLTADFEKLGITDIPQTHAAFLKLPRLVRSHDRRRARGIRGRARSRAIFCHGPRHGRRCGKVDSRYIDARTWQS